MLEIEDLAVRFGDVRALDGMTFQVPAGRLVGFVGPNGSGKTTTMRTIVGLIDPQRGRVRWDGAAIDDERRRRIGYMPEERGLYLRWGVLEQVTYFGQLAGMDAEAAQTAARSWLERVGLGDRLDDDVQTLSHGNQQRVQLAVALVHDPDLLLLDEPFSGLDPLALVTMADLLREVAARGVVVLFSSHQLELVEELCQDAVIVADGRCVAAGDVAELRARSPHRTVHITFTEPVQWGGETGTLVASDGRRIELLVDRDVGVDQALAEARAHGAVEAFSYAPPDLSDLFRELVS